jgi:glucose/arabinose dehydrogenase
MRFEAMPYNNIAMHYRSYLPGLIALALCSCNNNNANKAQKRIADAGKLDTVNTAYKQPVNLPAPFATKSVYHYSKVIGWPAGKTPTAPAGFEVLKFADNLQNPRWIYVAGNGDIFVSEAETVPAGTLKQVSNILSGKSRSQNLGKSANRITLFRDTNGDGKPDFRSVFLTGLNQPFGMLIIGRTFYVANTNGIMAYPYAYGQSKITAQGKQILELPAGGYNNHWTRNIITNKDSSKLYITVGSGSNVGEHGMDNEVRRACILEVNPDGTGEHIYAYGLRNPQGMGWAPGTQTLWTAVNERDELGDELVPDYLTSVKPGGFYGWPYAYWGQNEDPRMKDKQKPDLVKKSIMPDLNVGAHTASLGLAFDEKDLFPGKYAGGAFIGQHGSWNRSTLSGYQVAFVPFRNGKPDGPPEPFLSGFIADEDKREVYGRPVGVAMAKNYMLVADDASNTIWCVIPTSGK